MKSITTNEIAPQVYFREIKDNRFKTMRISINMITPLTVEDNAKNALLTNVLCRSTAEYPEFTVLSKHLASLYGAGLSGQIRKIGDNQILSITVSGLDDRYTFGETLSQEFSTLLCKILFEPKLNGNAFCDDEMNQEKRQLLDTIDSEYNDKRAYSNKRFIEIMCANEPFGLSRFGTKEQINNISPQELYTAWQKLLSTAVFNIMFIGDCDTSSAKKVFTEKFSQISRNPVKCTTQIIDSVDKIKEEKDTMELAQSKMILGFRTPDAEPNPTLAMRFTSALLGGTAHSKLFNNVREKMSLCYYCSSRYNRTKGIMHIESGVEKSNIEKAKEAILNEIEEIKKGNITDFEMEATKKSMCNDFASINDTSSGVEAWYVSQLLDDNMVTSAELCKEVLNISKEQVMESAKKLKLDTIYVLESK